MTTEERMDAALEPVLIRLREKERIISWLILGSGIHGLPVSAASFLTKERICELYNVEPEYFKQ